MLHLAQIEPCSSSVDISWACPAAASILVFLRPMFGGKQGQTITCCGGSGYTLQVLAAGRHSGNSVTCLNVRGMHMAQWLRSCRCGLFSPIPHARPAV